MFVYYLPEADGGISQELVDRLAQIAEGSNATFLAPYPDTHRRDRTHAHRVEPTAILSGEGPRSPRRRPRPSSTDSSTAFECTGNAPESSNAPC